MSYGCIKRMEITNLTLQVLNKLYRDDRAFLATFRAGLVSDDCNMLWILLCFLVTTFHLLSERQAYNLSIRFKSANIGLKAIKLIMVVAKMAC